ncbi:MAG: formate dehydrogenase subunit delta [Beijerinckiaceae bacterium]|nr:formate dehydrogenase subunit delta [Beijerinckiaceae bacterium]
MSHNKLIAMANQIAQFFRSYPHDRAVEGVAKHIAKFWSPHMRKGLDAEIAAHPEAVDELVVEAVARKQAPLEHAA